MLSGENDVTVTFRPNGALLQGKIFAYDVDGGGVCWGVCSSYDILGDDGVLYKHVPANNVKLESGSQK